ncbi:MAG: 2Fe-2S iron-sulfur cluster-binding protein [Candidatus Thermoplasmatota archaeon]|nr:2Fe-2S iron-sulfur cluster-binding protein [Candidatus Thermoplasmatota archaeon]MEE2625006.1 2Fe-2S iron-sulfur cluster-binding protein [Candidatus Thermoplasmatota archaeon]
MSKEFPVVRFFRGSAILGSAPADPNASLVEIAELAGVIIPTNCTAGNCGTCLVSLVRGTVEIPEELPPGLDEELVDSGGILTCCLYPSGPCDINLIPPL